MGHKGNMQAKYDIVIVGDGMVGATLALGLRQTLPDSLSWAVIEGVELLPQHTEGGTGSIQPSYDGRSSALSAGTRQAFESLGVWHEISRGAEPITDIHVSDRGHCGITRMNAAEHKVPALGYVVDNHWLGQVLVQRLRSDTGIDWLCPMTVRRVQPQPGQTELEVFSSCSRLQGETITAKLVVVADGGRSPLLQQLGIESDVSDYQQVAIIANLTSARPHNNVAYERFTDEGPMALLPRVGGSCAMVWTMSEQQAKERMELVDEDFLRELQERFGYRLGRLEQLGSRVDYPLQLRMVREQVRPGLVVLGNAAHSLHPVAGQGFNLSVRDVMALIETLSAAVEAKEEPGALDVLHRYLALRDRDQTQTLNFSDRMVQLFSNNVMAVAGARNMGLLALDALFPLKDLFARQSMGLGAGQVQGVKRI